MLKMNFNSLNQKIKDDIKNNLMDINKANTDANERYNNYVNQNEKYGYDRIMNHLFYLHITHNQNFSNLESHQWENVFEVSKQLDLSIGVATLIISVFVLLLWIPLKESPGFGTLLNILLIAFAIDLGIAFLPQVESFSYELIYQVIFSLFRNAAIPR